MDTIAILRTLVGFDTVSRNSNLALIRWAADYLDGLGARVRLTYDDAGRKANLLGSFGPDGDGGIVLSGHTDVVPVDWQNWATDPFELTERNGCLHGRGSADMKGFIAACLAAAAHWPKQAALRRPIRLALSYDEEIGCFGVPRLVADMVEHAGRPAIAVIGEPTGMRIADRHRGFYGFHTVFEGRAAHSSDPAQGASAIDPAADFVRFLLTTGIRHMDRGARITTNVGRIDGGTAINIVPDRCAVTWEFRSASVPEAENFQADVEAYLAKDLPHDVRVRSEKVATVPALVADGADAARRVAAALGGETVPVALPFGTEAGFFQQARIPCVVCGPGSIDQAHQANEWIAVAELEKADRFMRAVGGWASE